MRREPKKRKVGRPRIPNRCYAGPIALQSLDALAQSLEDLGARVRHQVKQMLANQMESVWISGREIMGGLHDVSKWISKLEGEIKTELTKRTFPDLDSDPDAMAVS